MRNQAMRGDFTKYGMLQQYRTGLDSEPVRSIVQTAVSSALNAQRDAYTTVAMTATTCSTWAEQDTSRVCASHVRIRARPRAVIAL